MTNAMTHALRYAGLISEPAASLPPRKQRKAAADRMWLLYNGLPSPEQQRKTERIILAGVGPRVEVPVGRLRLRRSRRPGSGSTVATTLPASPGPNGLAEEFSLMFETDCAILRYAVNEDPSLTTSIVGRRRI